VDCGGGGERGERMALCTPTLNHVTQTPLSFKLPLYSSALDLSS
jgi:hypothetical protein